MVLERIANPSIGESRFLSSSLSRTAKFCKCQQEKVTLYVDSSKVLIVLKGKRVRLPADCNDRRSMVTTLDKYAK